MGQAFTEIISFKGGLTAFCWSHGHRENSDLPEMKSDLECVEHMTPWELRKKDVIGSFLKAQIANCVHKILSFLCGDVTRAVYWPVMDEYDYAVRIHLTDAYGFHSLPYISIRVLPKAFHQS